MIPQQISINEWAFVTAVALAFGYVGWRHGLTVALCMLVALGIGLLFADRIAKFLEPWINFTWKVILAVVRERAFSPEELFKAAVKQPALITQHVHRMYVGSVVFYPDRGAGVSDRAQARVKKAPRMTTRILAVLIGAVNGYVAAFFLFPRFITTPTTVITMSNVNIRSFLQVRLGLSDPDHDSGRDHGGRAGGAGGQIEGPIEMLQPEYLHKRNHGMTPVESLWIVLVVLFGIVGIVRGFLKELGITLVLIVLLFGLTRL